MKNLQLAFVLVFSFKRSFESSLRNMDRFDIIAVDDFLKELDCLAN